MCPMRGAIRIAALVLVLVVPVLVSTPLGTSAASPQGLVVVRSVWSRALAQPVRTLVYLPPSYRPGGPRLPTLYLLHGTPGTPDGLFALGVQDRLDSLIDRGVAPAMIVVAPSGGPRPDSDTEWDDSVADAGARWGTFVTRDLVEAIDAAYATKHGRGSRAIAGISMGGYGAINLALGHSARSASPRAGRGTSSPTRPASTGRKAPRPGRRARRCSRSPVWRPHSSAGRSRRRSTRAGRTASSARTCRSTRRSRSWAFRTGFRAVAGGHDASVWRAQMTTELKWIGREFQRAKA